MRWLLILSRLAFICNIFFLVAFSLQVSSWISNQDLVALIAILGYALAFLFNPLTVFSYLVVLILRRSSLKIVPIWLIVANTLFLVMQLLYFGLLNTDNPLNA